MENLNKYHEAINFTIEMENEDRISFLDMMLIREGSKIEIDIFRKPTDVPQCIPANSYHPIAHKMAVFESAVYRMWRLPLNNERRHRELEYLKRMARLNGHSEQKVVNIYEKRRKKCEIKNYTCLRPLKKSERTGVLAGDLVQSRSIVMPFCGTMSYKIEKALRQHGLNVCYESRGTLREIIGSVKLKRPEMEESGVYEISCQECDMKYIGQTKRRLETRNNEHERACKQRQEKKSSVAEHCNNTGHTKGDCKLIKKVERPWQLEIWESLFIERSDPEKLMNTGEPPLRSTLFEFCNDNRR